MGGALRNGSSRHAPVTRRPCARISTTFDDPRRWEGLNGVLRTLAATRATRTHAACPAPRASPAWTQQVILARQRRLGFVSADSSVRPGPIAHAEAATFVP